MKITTIRGWKLIMSEYSEFQCSKADAVKWVSDFISDTRKDIEPIKRRRTSSAATIFAIVAAVVALVPTQAIEEILPESAAPINLLRATCLLVGAYLFDKNTVDCNELLLRKDNLIIEAEKYRGELHDIKGEKVKFPNYLEGFLIDRVDQKELEYHPMKNILHRNIRIGVGAICSVSMFFSVASLKKEWSDNDSALQSEVCTRPNEVVNKANQGKKAGLSTGP